MSGPLENGTRRQFSYCQQSRYDRVFLGFPRKRKEGVEEFHSRSATGREVGRVELCVSEGVNTRGGGKGPLLLELPFGSEGAAQAPPPPLPAIYWVGEAYARGGEREESIPLFPSFSCFNNATHLSW